MEYKAKNYYEVLLSFLLFLGRLLGFPLPEKFGAFPNRTTTRKGAIFYSVLMILLTLSNLAWKIKIWTQGKEKLLTQLNHMWGFFYYFIVFLLHTLFFITRDRFSALLTFWKSTDYYGDPQRSITNRVYFLYLSIATIFSSTILETCFYDYNISLQNGNSPFLKKYMSTVYAFGIQDEALSLEQYICCVATYTLSKLVTIATVYGDVLCIILSYGVFSRVHALNEFLAQKWIERKVQSQCHSNLEIKQIGESKRDAEVFWTTLYAQVIKLRKLADLTSRFISPILFLSLALNALNVVIHLDSLINALLAWSQGSVYELVSFWHFIFRSVLVIHYAASVYQTCEETLEIIESAPDAVEEWTHVEKILTVMKRKPIGITFFGAFFITKNHFLCLLSFIFSIEILILQMSRKSDQ